MRFHDTEPGHALLKSSDGRPIKIDATEAANLSAPVYEFNETLYLLLLKAHLENNHEETADLWAAAHPFIAERR